MNIRLPINFNSPYKARNIAEFWRRWHMTLSRWLRDYLYIPLGGKLNGKFASAFYLSITFLIGGLWHGASWTFVAWGAAHGLCVIFYRLWREFRIEFPNYISMLITFLLVNVMWVLFRSDTIEKAFSVFKGMMDFSSITQWGDLVVMIDSGIGSTWLSFLQGSREAGVSFTIIFSISLLIFCFIAKNTNELIDDLLAADRVIPVRLILSLTGMTMLAVFFMLYAYANPSPFIYFQF